MRWIRGKCKKIRFKSRSEAYFWGPPYRCECGYYHITHYDRRILWGRVGMFLVVLMFSLYALWVLWMVALELVE